MAFARQNRQRTIVVTHKIVEFKLVNPSVVFNSPLEVIPNITARSKKIYPEAIFILKNLPCLIN